MPFFWDQLGLRLTCPARRADPGRQFALVEEHVCKLRALPGHAGSHIMIFVERNLGFEAHHHKRALAYLPNVSFYLDTQHGQVGMITSNPIKHAMARLVVVMLSERRIGIRHAAVPHPDHHMAALAVQAAQRADPAIVSRDAPAALLKLREQLEVYSYQFKAGVDTFQQDRVAISGKVGGMRDDLAICLQLACYWTQLHVQRAADCTKVPRRA
jgi:hypothetical protein